MKYLRKLVFAIALVGLLAALSSVAFADAAWYTVEGITGGKIQFDSSTGTITSCEENVTVANIPDKIDEVSVTSIEADAFYHCTSLTSVTIPDSVTSIGSSAFESCTKLESVTIGSCVTSIGTGVFTECNKLISIAVDPDNEHYSSDTYGVLFNKNKDETILIQYPMGNTRPSYSIPDSVTSIGDEAFSNCTKLTSVEIPNSVTSIGKGAFNCCGLTSVDIGNGVTSIGDEAFFMSCLTSVEIPNSVTSIGACAFECCYKLTSVYIGNGVTSIGREMFAHCTKLTSVEIPHSITSIGNSAFYECTNLTDVYYGGTQTEWKAISVGSDNTKLTDATIHYCYTTIAASWDKTHYNPGDIATATISLAYNDDQTNYAGLDITLDDLSAKGLTLTGLEFADLDSTCVTDSNVTTRRAALTLSGTEEFTLTTTPTTILTATYTVSEDAAAANLSLGLTVNGYHSADGAELVYSVTPGTATLHNIVVTLTADDENHVTAMSPRTLYGKYNEQGLYTDKARTTALTAADFSCTCAAGYKISEPMWTNGMTEYTDVAALLALTYTENKTFTLRTGAANLLTIDTTKLTITSGATQTGTDGSYYIVEGTDVVMTPVTAEGTVLLGVSAKVGEDEAFAVTNNYDGTYTLPGSTLTGDVTLTYDTIQGTVGLKAMSEYNMSTTETRKLLTITTTKLENDKLVLHGETDQELYWSDKYNGYVGFVDAALDEAGVRELLVRADGAAAEIGYDGDTTGDGKKTVRDALLINAWLHQITWKDTVTDLMRFAMDVNGDGTVDVADIQRTLVYIVGKTA